MGRHRTDKRKRERYKYSDDESDSENEQRRKRHHQRGNSDKERLSQSKNRESSPKSYKKSEKAFSKNCANVEIESKDSKEFIDLVTNNTESIPVIDSHTGTLKNLEINKGENDSGSGSQTLLRNSLAILQPLPDQSQTTKSKCFEEKKLETDSEEDIMFDWNDYMWELNRLFFSDEDLIKKGTEQYRDFFKFLKKYQALHKQKRIKKMCDKSKSEILECENSKTYNLPLKYDKRYCINFGLRGKDLSQLQQKLPPVDLEDKSVKRLSTKRLSEFKFILLLYLDFAQKQKFNKLKGIRNSQKQLPIAEYKEHILKTVKDNTVIILAGDTGCGKSTQIPQYLLNAGYTNIACTQPRRIACISLSKRVAYETLNEYGSSVGFQIRFEKRKTEHTKIVFLTEGLLLRQIASDTMLLKYDVVILDEIHERHLQTDFLLGVMKCLIVQRPEIKVILMSATINIDLFSNYFMGTAPVIQIPGRLYPIELKYFPITIVEKSNKTEKLNPAPFVRILQLIDSNYPSDERGDVLMFLSGMKEITTVMDEARIYAQQSNKWVILTLHSTLSVSEQEKVFDVPPQGVRKCIISTNIAETSVTIDGVRFVVDSGKVKEMSYDPVHKMQKLKEFWVSQASAEQRKGRAGRTGPGVCFRLFSEAEYDSFTPYTSPEILRVPLDSLILQMIAMGLPNIKLFPFIEPPTSDSLDSSLSSLKSHSALTREEELTSIGELLSQLPLDVSLGKMLIMGSLFHRLGPVLSLAAAMSVQSPFTNRAYRDPDCVALNKVLQSNHGDPFTLLMAYREWLYIKTVGGEDSRRWCRKRGLEEQRFYEITKLRQQFTQMLQESGMHTLAENRPVSSNERMKRYGELSQLRQMKRELYKQGPRKTQVLKVDHEGGVLDGGDDGDRDVGLEIKNIDFKIRYDDARLTELYKESKVDSFKDVILLKIILCSGLYPNIGIADEHNSYRKGSDQLFHTDAKPFVVLHPNSVFAAEPETLQLTQPDIAALPGFTDKHPCSNKHQLLTFVSLLETNKAYLVNAIRTPTAQTLLLFSRSIDTNADIAILVCDNFIELKFADRIGAQNLLLQAATLRCKWKTLLELRIRASKPTVEDKDRLCLRAFHLEKQLSAGLIDLYMNEQFYSAKRLLPADVKLLHYGPGPGDMVLCPNPFSEEDETCLQHETKGGVILTDFITYNCLIDVQSSVTSITSYDAICPYCDQELHQSTLERLRHMRTCMQAAENPREKEQEEEMLRNDPSKKEFWCQICKQKFWFTIKEILKHKNAHS